MINPVIEQERLYGAHNYEPLPVILVRGQGVYVWDDTGKKYLDMMSAYSAVSHGHCHPKIVKTLQDQASKLTLVSRAYFTDKLGPFLQKICELTGFEKGLPMNTGAEAVETAIKATRKWAYKVKGVPENQAEIIACAGNFHGRTTTVISMSTEKQYREGFGPFTPGVKIIPYGDVEALRQAITPNTAAFLVEPVQGEGGILVPPPGYLKACSEICKQNDVLLICDEVQTGLGRTGKLLAHQWEDIKPDGIILGKALGGGMLPVSMFLADKKVMDVFNPDDHGSTFGGNPLAAAVGCTALEVLIEENLVERAATMGEYFQQKLKTLKSPLIKAVRGKGLLIGLEIDAKCPARKVCLKLMEEGVLSKDTHGTVVRFAPPLIVTEEQIDMTIKAIEKALTACE